MSIFRTIGLIIICIFFRNVVIVAHSPSQTHAVLYTVNSDLIVEIDLPWTSNDAARQYLNILEGQQIDDISTDKYYKQYINNHFYIISEGQIKVAEQIQIKPSDHSHSITYQLRFEHIDLATSKLVNTLMLGYFGDRQKNFMKFEIDGKAFKHVGSVDNTEIRLLAQNRTVSFCRLSTFPFQGPLGLVFLVIIVSALIVSTLRKRILEKRYGLQKSTNTVSN